MRVAVASIAKSMELEITVEKIIRFISRAAREEIQPPLLPGVLRDRVCT